MLKARTATGRATPVPIVEAELGRGIAALPGQWCLGEQLAHCVPGAHVTGRVGSRSFADGGLVHKHHIRQVVSAHQAVVQAGCFRGLAKLAQQSGSQNVLHQCGFTRTTHTRHAHQTLQWKIYCEVFQVVVTCALQNQTRRAVSHRTLEAHAHLLARAQVSAG